MTVESSRGTGEGPTVDIAATRFLSLLSADPAEDTQPLETPPADEPRKPGENAESEEPEGTEHDLAAEDKPEGVEVEEPGEIDHEPKFRVKVDGHELEVTQDELIKGYSRTQDYTRKTQAAAEERKALKAETTAVRAERQRYAESIAKVDQALKSVSPQEPDWAKKRNELDPAEFSALHAEWQIHRDRVQAVEQETRRAQAVVADDQLRQHLEHVEAERAVMLERIPSWNDAAVANREKAGMRQYALAQGFTDAQIQTVTDAKTMVLLREAYLKDQTDKGKPVVRRNIDRIKTATPGSASAPRQPVTERAKAFARLEKTGHVNDAAAVFQDLID